MQRCPKPLHKAHGTVRRTFFEGPPMQAPVSIPTRYSLLSKEAQSYLVSFTELPREIYWFNDPFTEFTWSKVHSHAQWGELAYVRKGCMVMCTARGNYMVRPDSAVWIPPGLEHGWYIPCPSWDCGLYIHPPLLEGADNFLSCHVLGVTPLVRELILHLCVKPYPYDDEQTREEVHVLLGLLKALPVQENPKSMPTDPRLIELCATIITNPSTPYSLTDWGRILGMSERTLSRLFLREMGVTFCEWRHGIRMDFAHERLKKGESVTNVAHECGYSSLSAFIERYKTHFRTTPGKCEVIE